MTASEFHGAEITLAKDNLLDSHVGHDTHSVNGALQSQWEVIRDGMAQGAGARVQQMKDNPLLTGVETASSFGLGAATAWALNEGGKVGLVAKVGAGLFTALMAGDLARRGMSISDAYSNSNGDTSYGQAMRRDAIAKYAGAGVVDYSLMFASGGLGASSVRFGPKMVSSLKNTLEPLNTYGAMEPALIPVRNEFRIMDLGERGRLGAVEKAPKVDPIATARETLNAPHKQVGLGEIQDLMIAKHTAAHPEVRPIYEQMAQTLGQIDTLKPLLASDEAALLRLGKQLTEAKSLKPELKEVNAAENAIGATQHELSRLQELRAENATLNSRISKFGRDAKAGQLDAAVEPVSKADLQAQSRELVKTIQGIEARSAELPAMRERLTAAQEAYAKRQAAVEAGKDAEVLEIQAKMTPVEASIAARKAELLNLSESLGSLDKQFKEKALAIRPSLEGVTGMPESVPRYVKPVPKVEIAAKPSAAKTEAALADTAKVEPAPKPVVAKVEAQPKNAPVDAVAKPAVAKVETAASNAAKAEPGKVEATKIEPARDAAPKVAPRDSAPAQRPVESSRPAQPNEKVERRAEQAKPVTSDAVNRAETEARSAVDDFARTLKRHTTALKKVNDYIGTSFDYFRTDEAAARSVSGVARNVQEMLGKLENWDRPPGWFRDVDRAQIMQRNGFDAQTMGRFDSWFATQRKAFNVNENMMPDRWLSEVQQHLTRRVSVESVKNWLRTAAQTDQAVSPIVNDGFKMMAEGKLPDGTSIPKGSDMVVLVKRNVNGKEVVLPYSKNVQDMQRFDDFRIKEGLRKLETIKESGPQGLSPDELYGFRLDHDPARLVSDQTQVGFAILKPAGQHGKNILHMEVTDSTPMDSIPKALAPGANTGVLYGMLNNASKGIAPKTR